MRILLDTHAWIWLVAGDRRIAPHARSLARASSGGGLLLSTISAHEAALIGVETDLGKRSGKQAVKMKPDVGSWIRDAIDGSGVVVLPVDAPVAVDAALLHAMHGDPFDRLIVATALRATARLATADAKVIAFAKAARLDLLELA